jgi:hypothetical protein
VARVYNLREGVALFLEEENLEHAERLRNEYFVSELAYLNRLCGLVVRVPGYRSRGPGYDSRRCQIF